MGVRTTGMNDGNLKSLQPQNMGNSQQNGQQMNYIINNFSENFFPGRFKALVLNLFGQLVLCLITIRFNICFSNLETPNNIFQALNVLLKFIQIHVYHFVLTRVFCLQGRQVPDISLRWNMVCSIDRFTFTFLQLGLPALL